MSAHHDDAPERLERLLDGAPPRDDDDRETVALLAAIRAAEPPPSDGLRERIAALPAGDGGRARWWRRLAPGPATSDRAPRRRALWIAAPVAAAALAAAVIIPTAMRAGTPGQPVVSNVADATTADSESASAAAPAAPMAAPAVGSAPAPAPARAGQPPVGLVRVRVADPAALAGTAARALAAVEALRGRVVAGRMAPRAGERRIVLVTLVPVARVDDTLAALGQLGAVSVGRRPDPESATSGAVALRVVLEAPAG